MGFWGGAGHVGGRGWLLGEGTGTWVGGADSWGWGQTLEKVRLASGAGRATWEGGFGSWAWGRAL